MKLRNSDGDQYAYRTTKSNEDMTPLAIPNLSGNEERYLRECVETNFVSSVGPFVDRFESMIADSTGAGHVVATCSGTAGLHAALTAVGVGRDDLVILPALTFIASANAISYCGADPWLFDIESETWTLDANAVRNALTGETERRGDDLIHRASGRRVSAIMPVYTLGLPARMSELVSVGREFGLPVVADAAAAIGATVNGARIGELDADLSVLSFNGNKTVTTGGGGAIIGNDEELCYLVRHLTTTARSGADYTHDRVGFNYRMTNLAAAVGCAQLERLDFYVERKRTIATRYNAALTDLPGIGEFPNPAWAESACWFSGVTVNGPDAPPTETVIEVLRDNEFDVRPFWKPVNLQVPYANAIRNNLDRTEGTWRTVLVLPCSTGLLDEEQRRVVDIVSTCVKGFSSV